MSSSSETSVMTLTDVMGKVNAFRSKLKTNRSSMKPTEKQLPLMGISDLLDSVQDSRGFGMLSNSETVTLGPNGFEDPIINDLVQRVASGTITNKQTHSTSTSLTTKPSDRKIDDSAENLIQKFHEDTIREIIDSEFEMVEKVALESFKEQTRIKWEHEKSKFLDGLELNGGNRYCFQSSPLDDNLTETYSSLILTRNVSLGEEEIHFARLIHEYVEWKLKDVPRTGIKTRLSEFCIRPKNLSIQVDPAIWEMWTILQSVLLDEHEEDEAHEKCEWDDKKMVISALGYLQAEYRQHLRQQVSLNLTAAELGGIPGIYSLVRAYLSCLNQHRRRDCLPIDSEGPLVDGKPAWQFVYLCLRCGDVKAAIRASTSAGLPQPWIHCLEGLCSQEVLLSMRSVMLTDCDTVDPYCAACLCLFDTQCDIYETDHSEVLDSIEDFLWFRLYQVLSSVVEQTGASSTTFEERFEKLQLQIRDELGEKYFVAGGSASGSNGIGSGANGTMSSTNSVSINNYKPDNNLEKSIPCPLLYFQCLLLTGQYEHGIELLCRYADRDNLMAHAVHMAIVLFEINALKVCGTGQIHEQLDINGEDDLLLCPLLTSEGKLNLYKLVKVYAENRFMNETTWKDSWKSIEELRALMDYLYLLRSITCKSVDESCLVDGFVHALSTLELNDDQILRMYGIAPLCDHVYHRSTNSLIDFYPVDVQQTLTLLSNALIFKCGKCVNPTSALFRFHAGELMNASDQLLELMSFYGLLCSGPRIGGDQRNRHEVEDLFHFANSVSTIVDQRHPGLRIGVNLARFFSLLTHLEYNAALNTLRECRIIPFSYIEVDDCVSSFISLPDTLKHVISDVIEACAICIQKVYKCGVAIGGGAGVTSLPLNDRTDINDITKGIMGLDAERFNSREQNLSLKNLHDQVGALIRYCESIPFHVRSSINHKLLQLSTSCSVV